MPVHYRAMIASLLMLLSMSVAAQAPVEVEAVAERPIIKQLTVTGTVTSPRTAVLSTAVAGLVATLDVDEGQRVEAEDPLLILDSELAQLALERARAEVLQRETALADARRRFAEAEKVGTTNGIARSQIDSLQSEVSIDEAALSAARAAVREQQAIVRRHTLKAPFTGVISERYSELGEWVTPGDGLLELVATDNLRFDFRMGQENFGALSPDTPVEITLDALPDQTLVGRVESIVPVKDPRARTFLLRVSANTRTPDGPLMITPGMSARATLDINTSRNGLAIARDAVLRFPDGRVTVWLVDMGGDTPVVREQIVRTGLEFDGLVEITSGLSDGDIVVVRGNETLQEGQSVSILNGNG